jgi:23S rRNA (pseudouridine1915-N3)-methyltransferase
VQVTVFAVGKLRALFREPADEYLHRLARYARTEEVEVREAGKAANAEEGRRQEGARLRERIGAGTHLVALDREGPPWSSEHLAGRLDRWRLGARRVGLLIGGSHGLDPALLAECDERWSLGALTLPHELARVVVYEQLYRAWTILRHEPYHK